MADGLVQPQMPPNYAAQYINSWLAGVGVRQRERELEIQQERYRQEEADHAALMKMHQQNYELQRANVNSMIGERDARRKALESANNDTELFNQYLAGWDPTEADAEQTLAQGISDFPGVLNTVGGRFAVAQPYRRLNAARTAAKNNFNTKRLAYNNYFDQAYEGAQETGILDNATGLGQDLTDPGGPQIGKWWEERVSKADKKSMAPYVGGKGDPKEWTAERNPDYWDPNKYDTTGNMWTYVTGWAKDPQGQPVQQTRPLTRNRKKLVEDIKLKKELDRQRAGLLDQVSLPQLGVNPQPDFSQGLTLDADTAQQIYQEAGGDVVKARAIAAQRGYSF